MKKIISLLFLMFLIFTLVGCGTDNELNQKLIDLTNALNDAEDRLGQLEEDLQSSDQLISDLQDDLTKAKNDNQTLSNKVSGLQSDKGKMQKEIDELKEESSAMSGNVNVYLASKYYLVVGETFQLFYRSIIQAVNPYNYYIKLTGNVGKSYPRYYELTPTAAGNQTLKVEVCDNMGNVLGSDTTTLIINTTPTSSKSRNILCVGDSNTAGGVWISKGLALYNANKSSGAGAINLLGTHTSSSVKHEGYSGWQWSTFFTGDGSSTVSQSYPYGPTPFKSTTTTSGISFSEYCTRNSYSGIDEIYVMLTWNGVGGRMKEWSLNETMFTYIKKFVDQFHEDYPNAKITLMGIFMPSVQGGLSDYYAINVSYGDNYGQFVTAMNYNQTLEAFAMQSAYSSFVRYVDVAGQFDVENNMPTATKKVNDENTTTETIGANMGIHASTNGYNQIGHVFYRMLSTNW